MLSIQEAKNIIEEKVPKCTTERLSLDECINRVLFSDVQSPLSLPPFRQSAMDGYAMLRSDLEDGLRKFKVIDETPAGKTSAKMLESGTCIRIYTGAVVPENCDVIVIQEHTDMHPKEVSVLDYKKDQKSNIRDVGAQIKLGEKALSAGTVLNAAAIGFIASMGMSSVEVYKRPRIGMLATGNELKKSGNKLELGEIYESNTITIQSALALNDFTDLKVWESQDNLSDTENCLKEMLNDCDVLIISGGISVGEYDYVKEALETLGVTEHFYKIKQKPGKPMFFGSIETKPIFALPGNPASLLVCFYQYVLPALKAMNGGKFESKCLEVPISSDYHFMGSRPEFLKGFWDGKQVHLLEGQGSFILKSFAEANALIYIHGEKRTIHHGEEVEIYPFN